MPQRKTYTTLFVEIVSFLTMFALIGTMTSNFWERYLIQTELSNMKSSLHFLKETVCNIGAAYDNLHKELKGIINTKEVKSPRSSMAKDSQSLIRSSNVLNMYNDNMMFQEIPTLKRNNNVSNDASRRIVSDVPSRYQRTKSFPKNASTATRNPLKSVAVNFNSEQRESEPDLDRCSTIYKSNNIHKCAYNRESNPNCYRCDNHKAIYTNV